MLLVLTEEHAKAFTLGTSNGFGSTYSISVFCIIHYKPPLQESLGLYFLLMISRTILTLVALLCSLISVNAQDYIITKNGEQIQARVAELSSSEVKYKKWSNLNGPLYTIKISDIARINYENGTSDVFSDLPSATRDELPATIFADRTGTASDTDLMELYKQLDTTPQKIKRLKLTAWIGSTALLTTGIILYFITVR